MWIYLDKLDFQGFQGSASKPRMCSWPKVAYRLLAAQIETTAAPGITEAGCFLRRGRWKFRRRARHAAREVSADTSYFPGSGTR